MQRGSSIEDAANQVEQNQCLCEGLGNCHTVVDDMVQGTCKVDWAGVAQLIE